MAFTKSKIDAVGAKVKALGGPDAVITDDTKLAELRAFGMDQKAALEVDAFINFTVATGVTAAAK